MEEEHFTYEEPEGASTTDMSLSGMLPSDYHEVYHDTYEEQDLDSDQAYSHQANNTVASSFESYQSSEPQASTTNSPNANETTESIQEELEQAKQEIEYLNSLVNQLSTKERKATEELVASKDMIRQALMRNSLLQRSFNLRIMGLLDPEVLKRAGVNDLEAADLMTLLQTSWHPMKTDFSDANNPKRVLNVNDEALQAIKACYGEEVAKDLVRAFTEIEEYNAAGRYPVVLPWCSQHERPMTLPEQIQTLMQLIKGLEAAHEKILSVFSWVKPMLVPVFSLCVVYLLRTTLPHLRTLYRVLKSSK